MPIDRRLMDPGALLMEYTVTQSDSIERIAAVHDCTVGELMKMNRLATRMIFPGQKLLVPCPMDDDDASSDVISKNRHSASQATIVPGSNSHSNEGGRIQRGPGMAVQVCSGVATKSDPSRTVLEIATKSDPSRTVLENYSVSQIYSKKIDSPGIEEMDTDCMKRFIKLKVKQMTEMNGTVTGTLLVTPNALMFDPDIVHPLVLKNGQDLYIMMVRMEEVMSITMFKSATALTDAGGDREIHDLTHQDLSVPKCSALPVIKETVNKVSKKLADSIYRNADVQLPRIFFDDMDLEIKQKKSQKLHIEHVGSDFKSVLIARERNKLNEAAMNVSRTVRRTCSDPSNDYKQITCGVSLWQKSDEMNRNLISGSENKQPYSSQPSTSVDNARTGLTFNPLSKLGRTLSIHANTIRGSVTSGTERMTHSAVSSTKSLAQGVVSQSKAVAGTLQTGIQTSVKMAASHAKTAVGAVAAVPQGIASMSSGLFSTSQYPITPLVEDNAVSKTRKEQNLATLLCLKEKTKRLREEAITNKQFFFATSMDEMLNLFKPPNELLSPAQAFPATEKSTVIDTSYYMNVRLNRNKKCSKGRMASVDITHSSSASTEDTIANCARQEFWFTIPDHKVDAIYHFLLQWNPEKYEFDAQEVHPNESIDQKRTYELLEDCGFVVLDSETSEEFATELSSRIFDSNYLNREWEIVKVQEMCRRMSLGQLDKVVLPLPDGAASSQILDEVMIRQVDVLPARAAGYPWINIYNSEKHGFSLHTFYRKMIDWDEEMSPTLLVIRDCDKNIFGAVVSTTVRPNEHFFGTGDSCFLYKYVNDLELNQNGLNQFFVKASTDSLSIGASGGHYGLWLDADLNHGRTQACETFQNEPLTGESEDFSIQFVEAYGFRME
uniref:Oxidation resistance protein 1 n=1 Tax=Onchocerca volvulus TaxID=6282 RepID=A0A8R1Y2N7_ONCVO